MSVSSANSIASIASIQTATVGEKQEAITARVHFANYVSKDSLLLATCQMVASVLETDVEDKIKLTKEYPLVLKPCAMALKHLQDATAIYKSNDPRLLERTGLSAEESTALAVRIQRVMIGFLSQSKNFQFNQKPSIAEWKITFTKDLLDHILKQLDFAAQDIPEEQQELSCFQYAVLKTNDVAADSWVFKAQISVTRLLTKLKAMGYHPVSEPKENDLALYFLSGNPIPQHMGVYRGNGMVMSKWGIKSLVAHTHPAFSVFPHYGRMILFMSKT